jgi:hypothetical protein
MYNVHTYLSSNFTTIVIFHIIKSKAKIFKFGVNLLLIKRDEQFYLLNMLEKSKFMLRSLLTVYMGTGHFFISLQRSSPTVPLMLDLVAFWCSELKTCTGAREHCFCISLLKYHQLSLTKFQVKSSACAALLTERNFLHSAIKITGSSLNFIYQTPHVVGMIGNCFSYLLLNHV